MRLLKRLRMVCERIFPESVFKMLYFYYRSIKFAVRFPWVMLVRLRCAFGISALNTDWGQSRGTSVMRYYLESFLEEHKLDFKGHGMEFQDASYLEKYGKSQITRHTVVNKDNSSIRTTLVCDITKPGSLPRNTFDIIVCTHVLHVIDDLNTAISELHASLKPGGVLLIGVPQESMAEPRWGELWRFTKQGLYQLLVKHFSTDKILVCAYGNSLVSAGSLRGLSCEDFCPWELNFHDVRFATEICARAVKSEGGL